MGMAASQARFLGLTARKSNVEYQAQQINQQRTSLANESANLYNQMMTLDVPTPPSSSDFKKTVYTLDDSATGNNSNYTIANMTKTLTDGKDNEYSLVLAYDETQRKALETAYTHYETKSDQKTNDDGTTYNVHTIKMREATGYKESMTLVYNTAEENKLIDNSTLIMTTGQIYKLPTDDDTLKEIPGYSEAKDELKSDNNNADASFSYIYLGADGENHFLTQDDLDNLIASPNGSGENEYNIYSSYTYGKETTIRVVGTIEESKNGRPSSVVINDNNDYPTSLKGKEFSITTSQVQDDDAYDDAMNDYEYEKELYEKSISDINAKTAIIQKQDQQLELRIDQLDTEQNAIKTEMDSVTKVIEDNVEKTFNIFG